jgi:hypothetical protein
MRPFPRRCCALARPRTPLTQPLPAPAPPHPTPPTPPRPHPTPTLQRRHRAHVAGVDQRLSGAPRLGVEPHTRDRRAGNVHAERAGADVRAQERRRRGRGGGRAQQAGGVAAAPARGGGVRCQRPPPGRGGNFVTRAPSPSLAHPQPSAPVPPGPAGQNSLSPCRRPPHTAPPVRCPLKTAIHPPASQVLGPCGPLPSPPACFATAAGGGTSRPIVVLRARDRRPLRGRGCLLVRPPTSRTRAAWRPSPGPFPPLAPTPRRPTQTQCCPHPPPKASALLVDSAPSLPLLPATKHLTHQALNAGAAPPPRPAPSVNPCLGPLLGAEGPCPASARPPCLALHQTAHQQGRARPRADEAAAASGPALWRAARPGRRGRRKS